MSGFFPVMMFGLPAACLAMYRSVRVEHRRTVGGLLLSMALTSFLTGITEPIEFSFLFIAPVLYVIHAVLTGLSMALMDLLDIRLGFGFSAGLFDYLLNYDRATRPLLMLPVGLVYFVIYYATFRYFIFKFDIKTPGREDTVKSEAAMVDAPSREAERYLAALGGAGNLLAIDACTTRLRLRIAKSEDVDQGALRALGAAGVVQPTKDTLQVVVGLRAEEIASNLSRAADTAVASGAASVDIGRISRAAPDFDDVHGLLDALGGASNIERVDAADNRLRVRLKDSSLVSESSVLKVGLRGIAWPGDKLIHVLAHGRSEPIAKKLHSLI